MPRDHQTIARRVGALLTEEGLWRAGMRFVLTSDGIDYPHRCYDAGGEVWAIEEGAGACAESIRPRGFVDLDDAATGGLLFHALGPGWCARRSQVEGAIPAHAWMVWKQGMKKGQESYGPTLGHAAAGAMTTEEEAPR